MKIRIFILISFITFLSLPLKAQDRPRMIDFDDFAPYLEYQNDTLYIINFWATWCAPCVEEIPAFEKVQNEFSNDKVRIILVSLDFPGHIDKGLIPFLQDNSISSEVILLDDPDSNRWIDKVHPEWSGAIPATLVYNRQNKEFYERSFTYNELSSIINSKIN